MTTLGWIIIGVCIWLAVCGVYILFFMGAYWNDRRPDDGRKQ